MRNMLRLAIVAFVFGIGLARPVVVSASMSASMVVDIPYQMKLNDALLHGRYLIVHREELTHDGPCTFVYEFQSKRLVTQFKCVHISPTDPAPKHRVATVSVSAGITEITSLQFKGSTEPIGVPGLLK